MTLTQGTLSTTRSSTSSSTPALVLAKPLLSDGATLTQIRPRKFYATWHTFISMALSKGLKLKFIAEYSGTSVVMIENHYSRFLASRVDDQLAMLAANPAAEPARRIAKNLCNGGCSFRPKNPAPSPGGREGFEVGAARIR